MQSFLKKGYVRIFPKIFCISTTLFPNFLVLLCADGLISCLLFALSPLTFDFRVIFLTLKENFRCEEDKFEGKFLSEGVQRYLDDAPPLKPLNPRILRFVFCDYLTLSFPFV